VPKAGWTLGDGDAVVVFARGGGFGSSGWGGVFLVLIGGATTDTWELREKPAGGSASVLTSVSGVSKLGAGDSIELEVIGTQAAAYRVNGGVATSVVAPTTTTINGAGKFGVELSPAAGSLDGIETLLGGTVVPVGNTIYAVGRAGGVVPGWRGLALPLRVRHGERDRQRRVPGP
jgi:hypothetical protein